MPRIASYVRLRGSEPNTGEENDLGYYEDAVVHTAKQKEDGSDRQDPFSLDRNYQKSFHEQQQKQLEDVNVSKGSSYDRSLSQPNLNGYHETSSPPRGASRGIDHRKVDLKDDVREARSGELKRVVSFRDGGNFGGNALKLSMSQSGKWQGEHGEGQAQLERTKSGRWKPFGDDQFTRTTGSPLLEDPAAATSRAAGQWAASIQRVASYRDILQQKQQQQEQQQQKGCRGPEPNECPQGNHLPATICTMHSACNDLRPASKRFGRQQSARLLDERDESSPARRARFAEDVTEKSSPPRRFQRQQTARFTEWERNPRAFEDEEDEKPSPPRRIQRQQTARFTDWEKKGIGAQSVQPRVLPPPPAVSSMVPRSSSEKIVNSQRSFSMRETSSARAEAESVSDQAPRRKSNATLVKPRVSFSDAKSRSDGDDNEDSQRIGFHEKWKDCPSATRQASFLSSTSQPLRYNYEQPGFVERKSTDGCGSYSTGGFRAGDRDHEKENARQPPLSRTFSTFSFADKATYRRMARTFTFSNTKHVQPVVVECVTCGKGLGIVIQGLPAGETSSFCKSCKPGLPGAVGGPGPMGTGEFYFPDKSTSRLSSAKSYSKKKRSMLDYCRKLFGMSKRYHNK